MEGNKITAITKEKTDVLKDAYKDTVNVLYNIQKKQTETIKRM